MTHTALWHSWNGWIEAVAFDTYGHYSDIVVGFYIYRFPSGPVRNQLRRNTVYVGDYCTF